MTELLALNEAVLEGVYPTAAAAESGLEPFTWDTAGPVAAPAVRAAQPKALIPVFPGTNCEYDTARASLTRAATRRSWWCAT